MKGKYYLHFESGVWPFFTLQGALKSAKTLKTPWQITRGSYVICTNETNFETMDDIEHCEGMIEDRERE